MLKSVAQSVGNPLKTSAVQVESWRFPWLWHAFSNRHGGISTAYTRAEGSPEIPPEFGPPSPVAGDLNLGWTKDDDPAHVQENRRRFTALVTASAQGSEQHNLPPMITVRQIHSAHTLVVKNLAEESAFVGPDGRAFQEADGLVTNVPGVLLGIQTADCVPVFLVDPIHHAVGVFHAGWRGTVARIVERGVATMAREFGSQPSDLLAAIGPSIGACCYTVGDEVFQQFTQNFSYASMLFRRAQLEPGAHTVDLWEANRRQLLDAGLLADSISVIGECTGCTGLPGPRKYFSHRMEKGFTGRMMSAIGIVP